MTKEILKRANELNEKIIKLEWYLEKYAYPSASGHRIKIIPKLRKIIALNFMGRSEYELDCEEFDIVNNALFEQLLKYKKEFEELKEQNK